MSSKITLVTETLQIPDVKGICFSPTEWATLQHGFSDVTIQLGYICLIIGFVFGAASVYGYFRMKDDGSSE